MKRFILLIVACVILGSASAFAQKQERDRENFLKELQEFKLKFLAQEMELREDQKKSFNELYTQMTEERKKTFDEAFALKKKLRKNKDATEADYEAAAKAMTQAKERDAAIEKKYDEKFATFLSSKQIYQMKQAEEKFRQKMEKMRKEKKESNKSNHHGDRKKK